MLAAPFDTDGYPLALRYMNTTSALPNEHIRTFLGYYIDLPVAPEYAVMIKGPWGSGKTHLIKNLVKNLDKKFLYVSLNGVSKTEEIEAALFRQLHPVLSNPKVKLLGKIAQGLIKTTVFIDLNGDGKSEGSNQSSLPELDLSKYMEGTAGLLIFDDLERCQLPVSQVLGYINYFVEHCECKVLILADEDRLVKKDTDEEDESKKYGIIREKVVGKTFEVELDVSAAIASFASHVTNLHARRSVEQNLEHIQAILTASSSKNLRHLRQALLDFSRIVDEIQVPTYKPDMLRSLLGTLVMYSLETKSGQLAADHIGRLRELSLLKAYLKDEGANIAQKFSEKYSRLGTIDSFISESEWRHFFTSGAFRPGSINEQVLQSKWYAPSAERPLWLRLQEMYRADDAQISEAIGEADLLYQRLAFPSVPDLLSVTGSLLSLSEHGVYQRPRAAVVGNAKKCIDALAASGSLLAQSQLTAHDHYTSFGYRNHSHDTSEYKEVVDYLVKTSTECAIGSYPAEAEKLLESLARNVDEFVHLITLSEPEHSGYLSIPILKYANSSKFVATLKTLEASELFKLCKALRDRYKHCPRELADERGWLTEIVPGIDGVIHERCSTMAAYWLGRLRELAVETATAYGTVSSRHDG